jgi:hypothetical protein
MPTGCLAILQCLGRLTHSFQLLTHRATIMRNSLKPSAHAPAKQRYALHKELVKVRCGDCQESKSVKEWTSAFLGYLNDSFVKAQPRFITA